MRFVDTNVLLYAISRAPDERGKAEVAASLLNSEDLALSVQVLQEFYVQATRATLPSPLSHQQAVTLVDSFKRFPVLDISLELVESAFECRRRHQISYWDAAIIEAARSLGCRVVLSEDLNDGQDYSGVRVTNPFRDL
ncbi:MAG: PIN domain-containing protein [Armatimonadetes bacterium]|nr:PIN domain-containing protein [Armatimonadota bacterium]